MAEVMTLERVRDWHREREKYADDEQDSDIYRACADAIDAHLAETAALREVARMALLAWDQDQDSKVGKLLRAMIDPVFAKNYMPGMHGLHAAQPAQEVPK